jgi:hypothetical protein
MRATILAALAAAAVLVVSACGSAGAAGSTTLGGAASIAPADAIAFVAIDSDMSSGQWDAVNGMLKKIPPAGRLLTKLYAQLEGKTKVKVDDVTAALGNELDLVVLPGAERRYVGLTQARDQAKLDALLKKLGAKSEQIAGWTAFADTQASLDAVKNATAKLADDNFYRTARAKLQAGALVHAYANGIEAQKLMHALATPTAPEKTVPFEWASADVVGGDGGLRVHAYAQDSLLANIPAQRRPVPTEAYTSHLVDEIPAGVVAVADFVVKPGQFQLTDPAQLPKQLKKIVAKDPALLGQLDVIFGGETAVYVRQGLPIPEITIVTQPNDTQAATTALDDVMKTLRSQATGILGMFQLSHAVIGGQLVASTSPKGLADFRAAGPKLSGDTRFKDAQKAVGMPAATTGFVYADLKDAIPLLQAFAPLAGLKLPPEIAKGDFSALQALAAFGTRTGKEQSFTVYLQVQ